MTHHVREVTRTGQAPFLRRVPSDQTMQIDIVLPLSNQAGLDTFLKALYDPSSPSYHHYLTPSQFTAQFGPTKEQYDAVVNFARDNGLSVTGGSRDRMDVQISAPASAVENALHITIGMHKHPTEDRTFYAPDREPTLALPFRVWHVSGLSNFSLPHPMVKKRSDSAQTPGTAASAAARSNATTGSGPSASFLGSDMRAAYYGNGRLTASGQTLGLLEFQGTNLDDVALYYSSAGQQQPSTKISLYSADGKSTDCNPKNCDDTEPTLDITQALGMAPGLDQITVYIGKSDTAIISAMTTSTPTAPLPMTIGCSWGWNPPDQTALDVYFKKMEAQGQTFFAASGDNSTWKNGDVTWPADDPYVVSVGGTDLQTAGAGGDWTSETAWADSGGGISPNKIPIPSWQQIPGVINGYNDGSTTLRNGPDVSANADFSFYVCANGTCSANRWGGTSFAAPMWAGYIALANEQASKGGSAVGFINPAIYARNASDADYYSQNFHDVASGTSGNYAAVGGYDLVTGWGSPTPELITALVNQEYSLSSTPGSLTAAAGGTASTKIDLIGCCSQASLSASAPDGINVSFSPDSITGSGNSTMTIAVASSVIAGSYSIQVTATVGTSHNPPTYTVDVPVTVTGGGNSVSLSVSPGAATVSTGSGTQATVTASGSFSSAVKLSASGMPFGTSVKFSPSFISSPGGSSTLNVSVTSKTPPGSYPITITGTSGNTTASTNFQLTVNP